MNNNIKISIIVPVYNAEKYIENCIQSIIDQSHNNIEIIFVDDGSVDSSLEILNKYKSLDKRVKVISKENGGVSSARNVGMNKATGEYILFVDSDDTIDPNTLKICLDRLDVKQADTVVFDYCKLIKDNLIEDSSENLKDGVIKSEKFIRDILVNNDFNFFTGVWRFLFSRKIIQENNIVFDNMKFAEDLIFIYKYMFKSNNILIVNKALYNYNLINPDSACKKHGVKYIEDYIAIPNKLCDIFTEERYINDITKKVIAETYVYNIISIAGIGDFKVFKEAVSSNRFRRNLVYDYCKNIKFNRVLIYILIYFKLYRIAYTLIKIKFRK